LIIESPPSNHSRTSDQHRDRSNDQRQSAQEMALLWTADPDKIITAVKTGREALESIH
jgi:hypothetical protein